MKSKSLRCLLLSAAMLSALAAVAGPAHASLTPGGATVELSAVDPAIVVGPVEIFCPDSQFRGTIAVGGRSISGNVTYIPVAPRTTCIETTFGRSVTVTCTGLLTLRETRSIVGTSVLGDVAFDSGFRCTIRIDPFTCTSTISGPQAAMAFWTFNQSTQKLTLDASSVVVTTTGSPCPSSRAARIFGTYLVTAVNGRAGRITIS